MTTTKLDAQKAIDWLDEHWQGQKECPICKEDDWVVSDNIVGIRVLEGHEPSSGIPVHPLIVVTCNCCAHTLLFNAVRMGLIEGQE